MVLLHQSPSLQGNLVGHQGEEVVHDYTAHSMHTSDIQQWPLRTSVSTLLAFSSCSCHCCASQCGLHVCDMQMMFSASDW